MERYIRTWIWWCGSFRMIYTLIDLEQGEEWWGFLYRETYDDDDHILLVLDYIEYVDFVHMMTSNANMSSFSFQTKNMNLCYCVTSNIMVHIKFSNNYHTLYMCTYMLIFVLLLQFAIESSAYVLYLPFLVTILCVKVRVIVYCFRFLSSQRGCCTIGWLN